jgi:peroxisomal 3,2-trans-enoyl-CoA isomerase
MLLFNKKINAHEACASGLVSKVIPDQAFRAETQRMLQEWAQLPVKSLVYSKKLIRDIDRKTLHEVNKAECERLAERWVSKDCRDALQKFFARKG